MPHKLPFQSPVAAARFLLVLLFFLLPTSTVAVDNEECGLYLAVSSTSSSEVSAWGLYAGKDIPADTPIGYPEIGINIPNLKANSFTMAANPDEEDFLHRMVDFVEEIIWVAGPAGARFELDKGRAVAAIPGAGALSAYNAKFTNADWNSTAAYKRPLWGEQAGLSHPNRGANSPFYHVVVQATTDIPAGAEVFMDYGENWAEEESEDDLSTDDFEKIDETIDKMIQFYSKHQEELDNDSKIQIYQFLTKDVMTAAVGMKKARRIAGILPPRPEDLHKVPEAGGALKFSEPAIYRKIEWLQQYGRCLDNIQPGPSTISNAGRGAFATRRIPAGGLVAPVPVVQIPDVTILDMHDLVTAEDGELVRESDEVIHEQLLLNYVYGHPDSSMVFYPTGAVVAFINHDAEKANAKLVWSDHPNNEKMWFHLSPEELMNEENMHMGLLMEVVATRDIAPGEEIFLDYGAEWQAAWEEHKKEWQKSTEEGRIPKEWPIRAVDMVNDYVDTPYKIPEELAADPYPESVVLKAYLTILDSDAVGTLEDPSPWGAEEDVNIFSFDHLRDCEVMSRQKNDEGTYMYTVRWLSSRGKEVFVKGIPHEAFVFVDAPGNSDQFMQGTFRRYIGIPDEIFPEAWRNLEPEDAPADEATK